MRDQVDKEAAALCAKADVQWQQWLAFEKQVLAQEKDKAYYKNLKNLSDSVTKKLTEDSGKGLSIEMQESLSQSIKLCELMVSMTKAQGMGEEVRQRSVYV